MKSTSIVEQLQLEAIDQSILVSNLLRKSKVIAAKLDLQDFLLWIEKELNGYDTDDKIPQYRTVKGIPKILNRVYGWQPIIFNNKEAEEDLSRRDLCQSIAEFEALVKSNENMLAVLYPHEVLKILRESMRESLGYSEINLIIDNVSIVKVLNSVRNLILDWSLKLEKVGILGEGVSFSSEDKDIAHNQSIINNFNFEKIDNFAGTLGFTEKSHTAIEQNISNNGKNQEINNIVRDIKKYVEEMQLDRQNQQKILDNINIINEELKKDKPEESKIKQFLSSTKKIIEGATESVVTHGLLFYLNKFLK